MSKLDLQYIAELTPQALAGDSNAFAEFFAATYSKQYAFACAYLKDEVLARQALQDAYIRCLKDLARLNDPALAVVWLNQITLRACFRVQYRESMLEQGAAAENPENALLQIKGGTYSVRRILSLPFSEAQSILLNRLCGLRTKEIASLLEIRRSAVRRHMESARRRLRRIDGGGEGA